MAGIDRLSALMARFALRVDVVDTDDANLFVIDGPDGRILHLTPRSTGMPEDARGQVAFQAHVDFGGAEAPLAAALPDEMAHAVGSDEELAAASERIAVESEVLRRQIRAIPDRYAYCRPLFRRREPGCTHESVRQLRSIRHAHDSVCETSSYLARFRYLTAVR